MRFKWLLLIVVCLVAGCSSDTMQVASQVTVLVGFLLTGAGGFGYWYFNKTSQETKDAEAKAQIDSLVENGKALRADSDDAKRRSEKLQETADSLQKELEPFRDLAVKLHPNMETQQALEQLRQDIESERSERLKLEEQLAPRRLAPNARQEIIATLKEGGPCPAFTLQSGISDVEAHAYLEQLAEAFTAAGCNVDGSGFDTGISANAKGLILAVPPQKDGPIPAPPTRIGEALKRAGLSVQVMVRPELPVDHFQLIVGGKPH